MRAYFTASIVGRKYHLGNYQKIGEILRSHNVEVMDEHILNVSEKDIQMQSKTYALNSTRNLRIGSTLQTFFVAETSFPSISVGYEISMALTVSLSLSSTVREIRHHCLPITKTKNHMRKYTVETLPAIISDFLQFVRGEADTRFTFFISSKQAAYLAKQGKRNRVPKSVYLRSLIDRDMI